MTDGSHHQVKTKKIDILKVFERSLRKAVSVNGTFLRSTTNKGEIAPPGRGEIPPCIENPISPHYNTMIIHVIHFVASLLLAVLNDH